MYSSEERKRGNLPDALNGSSDRRVLAQGEVNPHLIVIGSILTETAQVRLAEHHRVVHALSADRADQPLDMSVLPG
jgi:hypothetical protein